jgi:PAS domain S-box-containing protein
MDQEDDAKAELLDGLANPRRKVPIQEVLSAQGEPAEDEVAQFFTQSLDLLCIAGFDGYFKRLNPAWTTRLGWTLAELEARPFLDLVHPDDLEATRAEVATIIEGEEAILFANRFRHRDGSYRWLRWNARPVPLRGRDLRLRAGHHRTDAAEA